MTKVIVPVVEVMADKGVKKVLSHVDVVKKDIHKLKKFQHREEPLKLKPIKIDHFPILSARPLQQPVIQKKDCFYKQTSEDIRIDTETSVTVLHDECNCIHENYIEDCLKKNDHNMTTTRQELVLKEAMTYIKTLNIEDDLKVVIIYFQRTF